MAARNGSSEHQNIGAVNSFEGKNKIVMCMESETDYVLCVESETDYTMYVESETD